MHRKFSLRGTLKPRLIFTFRVAKFVLKGMDGIDPDIFAVYESLILPLLLCQVSSSS